MTAKTRKKPTGRPPLAASSRRTALIQVLVTDEEHAELERAAAAVGLRLSAWVRTLALAAARDNPASAPAPAHSTPAPASAGALGELPLLLRRE